MSYTLTARESPERFIGPTLSQVNSGEMMPIRVLVLTQRQVTVIDPEDFDLAAQYSWHAKWDSRVRGFYAYTTAPGGRTSFPLHALLTGFKLTDHVNHDTLDNRRINLRAVTSSQSNANRRANRSSHWPYKGVRKLSSGRWMAFITIDSRERSLGTYDSAEQAAEVRDTATRKYHGEYGTYNTPRTGERSALRAREGGVS
jgi:hypothetical protein